MISWKRTIRNKGRNSGNKGKEEKGRSSGKGSLNANTRAPPPAGAAARSPSSSFLLVPLPVGAYSITWHHRTSRPRADDTAQRKAIAAAQGGTGHA